MTTTAKLESAAFTIEEGTITKEPSGSRTVLKFAAPAKRHLDGGFEVNGISATLFDKAGRFITRKSAEWGRVVLANRAAWIHELPNDLLAGATKLVYDIEHRFDVRKKLAAGELPALPAEADGVDHWRWIEIDPRTLDDRAASFDIALWARSSEVAITYGHTPKVATDSFRCEYEVELADADQLVVAAKNFSGSLNYGRRQYDDTTLSMERRTMRSLKFFELRVRMEARAVVSLEVPLA